ncbi:MAG: HDOD domain-containing protein [Rhodocyclaceae bacterium]
MNEKISPPNLEALLEGACKLPTLPQVVTHILRSLNDDNADADSLVQQLNTDPAIVARLLAAANSSAFGLSAQVATTRQAILVLGLKTVRTITLATALIEHFSHSTSAFDSRQLWRHSLGVATCARAIAERIRCNPEAAFSAGLLHDIGQILMVAVAPDSCAEVRVRMRQHDEPIIVAERAVFGYDHAAAGGALAKLWNLPDDITSGIHGHHTPDSGDDGEMGDLIHIAEAVSHALDLGEAERNHVPEVSEVAQFRLGIEWSALAARLPEIEARYAGARLALGL